MKKRSTKVIADRLWHPQQESSSPYKVSLGETASLCGEPVFRGAALAEQVLSVRIINKAEP
ncbi:MAG: hypothetical protein IJD79_06645 [Clostridia bacterium]|nr:hypothetical protein [Clostridia bacterium]